MSIVSSQWREPASPLKADRFNPIYNPSPARTRLGTRGAQQRPRNRIQIDNGDLNSPMTLREEAPSPTTKAPSPDPKESPSPLMRNKKQSVVGSQQSVDTLSNNRPRQGSVTIQNTSIDQKKRMRISQEK